MKLRTKAWTGIGAMGTLVAGMLVYGGLMSTIATTPGCDESSSGGKCKLEPEDATLNHLSLCDSGTAFSAASTTIDNEFFPIPAGLELVLEGEDDGETIRVEMTTNDPLDVVNVDGVDTVELTETEYEDGELVEISRNWYAQADDGTVCYFGEDVDNYEDGVVVNNDGAWTADDAGSEPGIIMPASPAVGDIFQNEDAPEANDMAEVVRLGEDISTTGGDFSDTMTSEDCNPMDPEKAEKKVYASGVGPVFDNGVELKSFTSS